MIAKLEIKNVVTNWSLDHVYYYRKQNITYKTTSYIKKYGGEGGIRTHGRLPYAGFQDRYFRPAQSPLQIAQNGLLHRSEAAQYTARKSNFPVIISLEIWI